MLFFVGVVVCLLFLLLLLLLLFVAVLSLFCLFVCFYRCLLVYFHLLVEGVCFCLFVF